MRVCGITDPFDGWNFRKFLPCLLMGMLVFGCGTVVGYFVWDGEDPRDLTMEQAAEILEDETTDGSRKNGLTWLVTDKCLCGIQALRTVRDQGDEAGQIAAVYLSQIRKAVE